MNIYQKEIEDFMSKHYKKVDSVDFNNEIKVEIEAKQKLLIKLQTDLYEFQQNCEDRLQLIVADNSNIIRNDIKTSIRQYAKINEYGLIIEKGKLLYPKEQQENGIDITNEILKLLVD